MIAPTGQLRCRAYVPLACQRLAGCAQQSRRLASMTETDSILLTESAARRISEIVASEPENKLLRVSVEGGGCSGFQYRFDLVASQEPGDIVIERSGAQVLIDPVSLEYLTGSEIDFVDDLIGASFKIKNPNATASCGCGTSFSL
jgi:iron-sulfur cluster assembly accessory protein